tara:strand:- start:265 stop:495 length:231 start_codon:yes stop_codon:yes gene_type:complete
MSLVASQHQQQRMPGAVAGVESNSYIMGGNSQNTNPMKGSGSGGSNPIIRIQNNNMIPATTTRVINRPSMVTINQM